MARSRPMIVMLCVLALSGASYFSATSTVDARYAKHRSLKKAAKKAKDKKDKDKEVTKEGPTPRTPVDKQECISISQAYYGRAKSVWKGTKQGIPNEFVRVISDLDQFCGEEEFEKARVTMDWMSACMQNSKDNQLGYCSRSTSYFCALDQQSESCLQVQSEAR